MASTESRTLEIQATVRDKITRKMGQMARRIGRIIRTGMMAPFRALGRMLKRMGSSVGALAAALGSMFLVWRGGAWANQVLTAADSLNKLAQATGTAVEKISVLEQAFQFAGLTGEQFRAIITGLGRGVSAALNNVSSIQGQAFSDLGLDLETLRRGDQVEIFRRISEGLQQYNTQAEKAAVLQRIFPDNFQRLLPLLDDVEAGFLANVEAAQKYGAALSGDLADVATRTADTLQKVNISLTAIARQGILTLAREMAPALEGFAEFLRLNKDGLAAALTSSIRLLADALFFVGRQVLWLIAHMPEFGRKASEWLGDMAVVGGHLQTIFDKLRGADGFDGLRTELDGFAEQWLRLQERIARGGPQVELETAKQKAAELREEMAKLEAQFEKQDQDGASEVRKALDRARLRLTLAKLPDNIDQFALSRVTRTPLAINRGGESDADGETPQRLTETWGAFFDAFKQGMTNATNRWRDFAAAGKAAGETVVNTIGRGLENALTDAITKTKSWKEAFQDAARAILADLARIIARLASMRLIGSIFGSLFGAGAGAGFGAGQGGLAGGGGAAGGGLSNLAGSGGGLQSRLGGGGGGGGGLPDLRPVVVQSGGSMSVTIQAWDGADVERVLSNNSNLLANLQAAAVHHHADVRAAVKGAARHR